MPEPADVNDLYGLAPGEFTAARNALAKRLRAQAMREEAERVAARRRPTVTAWALNQVARQEPALIEAVLDAGRGLQAAMEQAVGGDPSGLREAQAAERRAAAAAMEAANNRMRAAGSGPTDSTQRRLADTLRAAVIDATVAGQLRDGMLDQDHAAPGFGLDTISPARPTAPSTPSATPAATPAATPPPRRSGKPGAAVAQEADDRREARHGRARLEAQAERLSRRADRLRAQAEVAERRAAEARSEAAAAAAEAEAARARLDET